MPKFNKKNLILIFLVLIGLILSFLLLSQHYRHLKNGFGEKSFCTVSKLVNCDAVDASDYSDLYGVPVAGLGFLYYLLLLFYFIWISLASTVSKEKSIFCFFLAAMACLVTLAMAYFSAFELGVLCLLCGGMYLVNFALLFLIPRLLHLKWKDLWPSSLFKPRFLLHIAGSFVFMMIGSLMFYYIGQRIEYESYRSATFQNIHLDGQPMLGNLNSKIVIVEFGDLQCRFCREFHKMFQLITKTHKDIAFYFIHYPFDTSCNPVLKKTLHPLACELARIGICAQQKGVFWPYHDLIFENQEGLDESKILEVAQSSGLDPVWLSNCVNTQETTNLLQKDLDLAKELNIRETPSIFINGRRLRAWPNKALVDRIISEEAKK